MATDRELLKEQQAGALVGKNASDPIGEVDRAHSRDQNWVKPSSENAATNVAETSVWAMERVKRQVARVALTVNSNVIADTSHYVVATVRKRDINGANGATIATWNTHNSAQGSLIALRVSPLTNIRTNTDAQVDGNADEQITVDFIKVGNGVVVPQGTLLSIYAVDIGGA